MRPARLVRRSALATAAVALLGLLNAPAAHADWSSYIHSWTDGEQSRRWDDQSNTGVSFEGCSQQWGNQDLVDVQLWEDISFWPDDQQGETRRATACFRPDEVSTGIWTGLSPGSYYFETDRIANGGSCCLLFVSDVWVDTTP
ncbi:hypothetical protein RM780_03690 [Streptomyces sp. DSM 44917]|uniref:Secreted protein n=1 Tax=Streptomyces boetiae TaxID=3075541 RepID=A0ABU2L3C2_9ACTN|nr:hypothetical protein [Streptomyces sp. DSM 44917]MDT0306065.1 hypothetical protein [Streptomyces sp. DSM 44917]